MRDPGWRFARVLHLLESGPRPLRPTRNDDRYIRGYVKFLTEYRYAWTRAESEMEQLHRDPADSPRLSRLFAKFAERWYSYRWHMHEDREWRALLQARILAREDDDEIAVHFGTLPKVVHWYERMFFNVRDRLESRTWIAKTILQSATFRAANRDGSMTENQRDLMYKLFAYYGGSYALDAVITGFEHDAMPASASGVSLWFEKTAKSLLRIRATTALQLFEANKFNVMQLFDLCFNVMSVMERAGTTGSPLEEAVADALSSLNWQMAVRDEQSLFATSDCLQGPAEPRTKELLMLSSGEEPQELLEYNQQNSS